MVGQFEDKFIKRSNESSALFHHFPGAIYEFRDRVWRIKEMHGNVPSHINLGSDAFKQLLNSLERKGIHVKNYSGLRTGISEVYPMTWYCDNRSCHRFVSGHPGDRMCTRCNTGQMRQVPLVVICDNCGNMDQITTRVCRQRHDKNNLRLVMYEREKVGTWRIICNQCLQESAQKHGFHIDNPSSFKEYEEEFRVSSDLDPSSTCRQCNAAITRNDRLGKRIVPAGANVVAPAFLTTFDKDMKTVMSSAKRRASDVMSIDEDTKVVFERIQKVFGIKEIYLADIVALNCTYGYRIGKHQNDLPFQDGTIFLKSDPCEAVVFQFDESRILPANRHAILHAISHALLQVAGYITGLGNEVYREHVDLDTCTVMVFTTEAGGCDLLVQEPAKLTDWLKRSRSVVHECKNQCEEGCPWCLHLRTWQCGNLNHNLDRRGLSAIWDRKVGL
jgi:hypothetical protein